MGGLGGSTADGPCSAFVDDDEYATGVDFIDQIRLTISVMGIADVYD